MVMSMVVLEVWIVREKGVEEQVRTQGAGVDRSHRRTYKKSQQEKDNTRKCKMSYDRRRCVVATRDKRCRMRAREKREGEWETGKKGGWFDLAP